MVDYDLIVLIIARINAAQAALGYSYEVTKAVQPTQQGASTQSTIYYQKLWDIPYGFPMTSYSFNSENQIENEITTQLVESTFQIATFVNEIPGDPTIPTASDVLNSLQRYLSSQTNLRVMQSSGVNMLRIRNVTNQYFDNDRSQYQPMPTLEWTLTHQNSITSPVPFTSTVNATIYNVDQGES
jgi:hypothetical protein